MGFLASGAFGLLNSFKLVLSILLIIGYVLLFFSLLNLYPMRSEMKKIRLALYKIAKNNSKNTRRKNVSNRIDFEDDDDEDDDDEDDDDEDDDFEPLLLKGNRPASFSEESALKRLVEEHEVRLRYAKDESERAAIRMTLESLNKSLKSDK